MKCHYCLEEIQDGALVCRYCGREPTPPVPRFRPRWWAIGLAVAFVVICIWAARDYQNGEARIAHAAACGGMSTENVKELIAASKATSGLGASQAQEVVISMACPPLGKN